MAAWLEDPDGDGVFTSTAQPSSLCWLPGSVRIGPCALDVNQCVTGSK
jgi:hypothetical protein